MGDVSAVVFELFLRYHDLPKRTETDRNGPKRTFVDTETDSLGTETDFCGYRNGLSENSIVIWGVKIDRNTKNRYKLWCQPMQVGYV